MTAPTGTVGPDGGTVSSLYFGVLGDTRPQNQDDNAGYPTAIINKIYSDMEGLNPRPQFILTTGDYQYDTPGMKTGSQYNSSIQIGDYQAAASAWTGGPIFSVMGNHECDGYTAHNLNLSTGQCNGVASTNYAAWFSAFVQPLGYALPYYTVPIRASDDSWTANFVIVACNAWSSTQQTWLQSQLNLGATYTFIVQHEDPTSTTGPCVDAVNTLLASATYTALIVGHVHQFCSGSLSTIAPCEYPWQTGAPKGFVVGNGGASTENDGYVLVQQTGSTFTVTDYDYSTNAPVSTFTFP